ncbi:ras-related protein Rab-24-like [Rhopilema esculentum]|uniref:ras-related protein Rab-24-like n=1 Tax=Rhopilema esculentum TaxID=499914 RepID=UPI0031E3E429|eukprot:gene12381-3039_t
MASKVDLKVVLLGKEYGGKTSLVERFINSRFNEDLPYQNTIGAAFGAKSLTVGGNKTVTLGIWDTAGSERYEAMSRIYYRGAGAAIVCYDLTDLASWERAKFWVKEINLHQESCKIYLCGTKKDLLKHKDRGIDYHDSVEYGDSIGAKVFETSSKTGENVDELFQDIADEFYAMPLPETKPEKEKLDLSMSKMNQNKQCSGCTSALPWNWSK